MCVPLNMLFMSLLIEVVAISQAYGEFSWLLSTFATVKKMILLVA